jgi:predicted ATPase
MCHYDANPSPTLAGVIRDHGVGCLAYLPLVYWSLGYPERARCISDACLARAEALSHPYTTAVAHNYAASFHLLQRGYQTGLYHAEQLIALATEYQWPIWIAAGTMYRGSALGLLGQPAIGIAQIEAGLKRFEATGAAMSLTTFLTFLIEIHLHQRHVADGLRVLDRALAHVNRHDEGHRKAELHRLHGELLISRYRNTQRAPLLDEAEARLLHALAVARQQQAISFELRSAISLSQLLRQHGRQVEAHALLSEVYGHFTEGFDTPDLQDARKLLQTLA